MDCQLIHEILDVLNFLGLLVTILLLVRQNKITARATRASVYQNIPLQMIEIDRFFFENFELRPYFYSGMVISEEQPDYPRVISVAEMLVDFMDGVLTLAPNMPEYDWDSWKRYFRDMFASSPALQKYWVENREWYPDSVTKVLDPFAGVEHNHSGKPIGQASGP